MDARMDDEPSEPVRPISVVHVSTASVRIAKNLASDIIQKDLAVGVSVLPTVSTMYKWKGEVVSESETLMIVKTLTEKEDELLTYVNSLGSIPNTENCEVIAMKVDHRVTEHNPYLDWLADRIPENSEYLSRKSIKKNEV